MQQPTHRLNTAPRLALALAAVFLFFFCACFGLAGPVQAQVAPDDTFRLQEFAQSSELGTQTDVRVIIGRIVQVFLGLLGTIAVVLIAYGGYLIMTSGGNEETVQKGKRTLINATIGFIIILASFAIVQFVLNKLSSGISGQTGAGSGRAPIFNTFSASGALGDVIRDHYPLPNQTGVKRNTRIAVTFAEPVDPGSVIMNTNGTCIEKSNPANCNFAAGDTPRYGDCVISANFDWARDCDRLVTSSVQIFPTTSQNAPVEAAALTTYDTNSNTFSFVFRPLLSLGSNTSTVRYTVDLTSNILRPAAGRGVRATSIFDHTPAGHYAWQFETDTQFDVSPPHVVATYPNHGDPIDRNTIIQVTFNEPMDPTAVQGSADSFYHLLLGTSTAAAGSPPGEWRLSNGYQTVEFVPQDPCGQNSCGELMYCLPISCPAANPTCSVAYHALIRTGDLLSPGSGLWDGVPFSGAMDLAGNTLDASAVRQAGVLLADGKIANPHQPPIANVKEITIPQEQAPDNYWWDFAVRNRIDRSVPYVQQVLPALDGQDIPEAAPLEILFSQVMWSQTLWDIGLEEYPSGVRGLEPIWYIPRFRIERDVNGIDHTRALLEHRAFGPNDLDLYYFVSVPSSVRGVNQNCIYPGRGPINISTDPSPVCTYQVDTQGQPLTGTGANCVPVTSASTTDTGCIQTTLPNEAGRDLRLQPDVPSCLMTLRRPAISPAP